MWMRYLKAKYPSGTVVGSGVISYGCMKQELFSILFHHFDG